MKKTLLVAFILCNTLTFAQSDKIELSIFNKISSSMKEFKVDTTAVPDDKLSKRIEKLRSIRGGFNINEAIEFKFAEERAKENANKEELDKLEQFFTTGNGKKWLDNAVIWIYRKQFTLNEVNQLIKFYSTDAGKKMAKAFPILIIQSLQASETITERYKLDSMNNSN